MEKIRIPDYLRKIRDQEFKKYEKEHWDRYVQSETETPITKRFYDAGFELGVTVVRNKIIHANG